MRVLFTALLISTFGCSDKTSRPESQPVSTSGGGGGQIEMAVDPEGPKPIERRRLIELRPALGSLTEEQLKRFSSAVNIMPSPCGQCDGLPLAHCVERDKGTDCTVHEKLLERATTLAALDRPIAQIKASINYPDTWFSNMGEGTPVQVTLYRDERGAFQPQTLQTMTALKDEFGDQIQWVVYDAKTQAPDHLGVRARPTWFINGHRFRGSQSARILSRYIAFEVLDGQE